MCGKSRHMWCVVTVGKSRWGEHMWCVVSLEGENTHGVWSLWGIV